MTRALATLTLWLLAGLGVASCAVALLAALPAIALFGCWAGAAAGARALREERAARRCRNPHDYSAIGSCTTDRTWSDVPDGAVTRRD
jgi:hypothetical protein